MRRLVADRPEKRLGRIKKGVDDARHNDSEVSRAFKIKVSRDSFEVSGHYLHPDFSVR